MAIYTFNNKCLEFDNKLITKASEPPTEGWYAREFPSYREFSYYMANVYGDYSFLNKTFTMTAKFNPANVEPTYNGRFWFETAKLSAGNDTFPSYNNLTKIFNDSVMFVRTINNIPDSNTITAKHNFIDKISASISSYGVRSMNDFEISDNYAAKIDNSYYSEYSGQYDNVEETNGAIFVYPKNYVSGWDNYIDNMANNKSRWYNDHNHRSFSEASAHIQDTYLICDPVEVIWNLRFDARNIRYKPWSANSADVINTLETTNYEFTATDMDIIPPVNYNLMLAFNNVIYPSARNPEGVIFYPH